VEKNYENSKVKFNVTSEYSSDSSHWAVFNCMKKIDVADIKKKSKAEAQFHSF